MNLCMKNELLLRNWLSQPWAGSTMVYSGDIPEKMALTLVSWGKMYDIPVVIVSSRLNCVSLGKVND